MFPPMTDEQFVSLKQSIEKQGFSSMHPIVLHEEMILDGFHRHLACLDVGVRAEYIHFIAPDMANTPLDFVAQENRDRRHLTVGQLAMVGAEILAMLLDSDPGLNSAPTVTETEKPARKSEIAAAQVGVSADSVKKAAALKKSNPEAAAEVKAGKKTLNQAKTASENKNAAHGAAVQRIEAVLGIDWVAKTKLKHKEMVEMSGLIKEEMKRMRPYLESGWTLKAALGYEATSLTHGHTIRQLCDRAIEFGKFTLEIDDWVISVKKKP